jgi:hypothetical protein
MVRSWTLLSKPRETVNLVRWTCELEERGTSHPWLPWKHERNSRSLGSEREEGADGCFWWMKPGSNAFVEKIFVISLQYISQTSTTLVEKISIPQIYPNKEISTFVRVLHPGYHGPPVTAQQI